MTYSRNECTPVPLLCLREQTAELKMAVMAALEQVVDTQGFANGPAVEAFERQLAAYLGVREVVCVNSGTTALHAALLCAGVRPGDHVMTVAHTWISTVWAVSYVGATPVLVDIDPSTCGMDPRELEVNLTKQTKAIVPVHLYGVPTDMDGILDFARRKGLAVIEDCAQSLGAKYKARHTGTLGLVNATSFYPGKNLGAFGEGGAILTNDSAIAARTRSLRDHAQEGRHNHVELGFNWRLDGFQGAVLSVKLPHLDRWNLRRREIAARYVTALSTVPGLGLLRAPSDSEPIWHIFPVFHEQRARARALLEVRGVLTGVHYPRPVHLQTAYAHLGMKAGALRWTERAAETEISLPMFPELSDDAVDHVIRSVTEVCHELA